MDVTVVDYNAENYKVLESFTRHKNTAEKFIESDWKNMEFSNEFDIIVGDHAISVLKKEDVPDVLEKISRALNKDSLFITKQYLRFGKIKSLEQIFKEYYKNFPNFQSRLITNTTLTRTLANKKTDYFVFKDAMKKITELYHEGKIKEKEYNSYKILNWDKMKFNLYVSTKKTWEKNIKPFFDIYSIDYSQDIYAKDMPIYILKDRYLKK